MRRVATRMPAPGAVLLLLTSALASLAVAQRSPDYTWRQGRATMYGGPKDHWSIHQGSCQYYYLDQYVGTGWDICAPSDQNWDWDGGSAGGGSCGVCYEVKCDSTNFKDGYGNSLDRTSACFDTSASVVVMVTDTCPCNYPSNAYSNKRWCCGDMFHLDISVYAFEKLAETKWGVIGIQWRRVPCNTQPDKRAFIPSWITPTAPERSPPWGWSSSQDRRPSTGGSSTASASAYASSTSDGGSSSSQASASSWSDSSQSSSVAMASTSSTSDGSGGEHWIFVDSLQQGWSDYSFSSRMWDSQYSKGKDGSSAYCAAVSAGGGVSFSGWKGAFSGRRQLNVLVKRNDLGIPDFNIQLLNSNGVCREIRMPQISSVQSISSDWVNIAVPLNAFSWSPDWSSPPATFRGCNGNNVGAQDITTVQFKNARGSEQWICLDQLKLT